jgi:ElaB/YqjD/DUF883 family membrane-anchored ribosome-binding protein
VFRRKRDLLQDLAARLPTGPANCAGLHPFLVYDTPCRSPMIRFRSSDEHHRRQYPAIGRTRCDCDQKNRTLREGVAATSNATTECNERTSSMSERAEGTVADAGEAVQQKINQVADAQDQLVGFIKANPLSAVLIALGAGYVLGKIT